MKKIYYLFIILLCFFNINIVDATNIEKAYDYTYESINVDLSSKNVILYNLTDNYKLLDIKSEEKVQIASLTKIMTSIVAIENIKNLDDKVKITNDVFKGISEYSKVGFRVGDEVTYRDLLYGVLLSSGADAVNALVLNISGSEDKFVKLMNDKAKELKLSKTLFDNAIGKDSKNNYSSAYDLARLLNYALSNETFKKIFTTRKYTADNLNLTMTSTLNVYGKDIDTSFIKGAKSGFTDGAGVCLASIATVNDVDYLLIVLGGNTNNRSNAVKDSVDIYNYLNKNYNYKIVLDNNKVVKKLDVKWGNIKSYNVKVNDDIKKYVKNTIDLNELNYTYEGIDKLKYGNRKGEKIGKVSVWYKDNLIATSDVYLNKEIKYYHPVMYGIMICLFIIMIISLIIEIKNRKKRKKGKI